MPLFIKNDYQVWINDQNVTEKFDPLLIDITVTDNIGTTSDTVSIKLADPGGSILLPGKGDPISVSVNGGEIFRGTVDEVRSAISKAGGFTISISGKGFDTTKKVKEPKSQHKDDAKFSEVAQAWGQEAGVQVFVHQALGSIQRAYWDMRNESFLHWGRRIADEFGATFKVSGDRAAFVPANDGQVASGQEGPTVTATRGQNLLDCDIAPVVGRPAYQSATVRFFDPKEGKTKEVQAQIKADGVTAGHTFRFHGPDEAHAQKKADSEGKKSERKGAEGTVEIIGNPQAQAGGRCIIAGTRPGIDGTYRITTATHKVGKKHGYRTTLSVDQPQGEAGKDSRGSKA